MPPLGLLARVLRPFNGRSESAVPALAIYGPDAQPTAELERSFFTALRMPNGTYKTTYERRLDDLNAEIACHLPSGRTLQIKDVAVSSGVSTLEWQQALLQADVDFELTATDLFIRGWLLALRGGVTVLTGGAGGLLQIDIAGFAFHPRAVGRRRRLLNAVPIALARHGLRRRLIMDARAIDLTSPRLRGVTVIEEDIMNPIPGQWDVIRAANVLNRNYFQDDELRGMATALVRSLKPGGILAVCRTMDGIGNVGSVLRQGANGLEALCDLRGGSEIKPLLLEESAREAAVPRPLPGARVRAG